MPATAKAWKVALPSATVRLKTRHVAPVLHCTLHLACRPVKEQDRGLRQGRGGGGVL